MKKIKLFLALLLMAVGVGNAQTYTHLGARITDLSQIQDGQKYMIFQCLGQSQNGTFYKWVKAGASEISLERKNMPLELQGVSMPPSTYADMVWTVGKVGDNYTFYNANQSKYAGENKAMSTSAYQFTIQDYASAGSLKGGNNTTYPNPPLYYADMHDTRAYNTCQAGEGFWIIGSATLAAGNEGKWWNGAYGEAFTCWSGAHPYAIFPVVESEGTPMYDIIDYAHIIHNRSDVRTTAVKLTVGGTTTTFNNLQTAAGWPVYWNLSDQEFTCYPGDEITPGVDGSYSGGAMQALVYLDEDENGFAEDAAAVDNTTHTVLDGHDLKTLSAYRYETASSWYNSKGASSDKASKTMPAFVAPADPGKYRMRYVVAWNSINPLGYGASATSCIASDGGIIVDVTLNVKPSPMVNITGFDQFDDYKYYALQTNLSGTSTNPRGYLCYKSDDADYLNARQPSAFAEAAQYDTNQQFRILCKDAAAHTYYLYCVANGKYAKKVSDSESEAFKLQFVDTPDDACVMTLQYLNNKENYPWVIKFGGDYLNVETTRCTHGYIVNDWGSDDGEWDDGNQFKIVKVGTLTDLTEKNLVEDAEYALSKVGVGYPAEDAAVRTELQAAYDAYTASPAPSRDAAQQATLQTKLANMFACRDIVLPQDGKVYRFQIRDFTGRLLNVYENGDGSNRLDVLAATDVQPGDQRRAQYMCHVINNGTEEEPVYRYVFINYYGDYMEWCGVNNDYPGFGDIYDSDWNDVELMNLYPGLTTNIGGTEKLLYGCFAFKFAKRHKHSDDSKENRAGVAVFKTQDGTDEWDGADGPFFNANYTSAVLFNEVSAEDNDFENRIEFRNSGIEGDNLWYATFYGRYPVVNPNDATPYYVTGEDNGYLKLEQVKHEEVITREFPVIFISENNNNLYSDEEIDHLHVGLLTAEAKSTIENNLTTYGENKLKGTYEANQPIPEGKDIYVLNGNATDGVGFFKYNSTVLPKNKAYYEKDASAPVRGFKFDFGGIETTIELNPELAEDAVVYDLSGRRVKSAANGLFIINGKKVIK